MFNCLLEGNYGTGGIIADVLCVVIILLFAVICTSQGFVKQVFGLFAGIGAVLLAFFFCDDLLALADKWWDLSGKLAESLNNGVFKDFTGTLSDVNIQEAVEKLGLPDFLGTFAMDQLQNIQTGFSSVGAYLSQLLAKYILLAIFFIVTFAVTALLLRLLKKVMMAVVKLPVIHSVDRVLGTLLGFIKGILFLYLLVYLMGTLVATQANPSEFIVTVANAMNESYIVNFMMQYNVIAMLIELIFANFVL